MVLGVTSAYLQPHLTFLQRVHWQAQEVALERFSGEGLTQASALPNRASRAERHLEQAWCLGAVQHRKAGLKTIASRDLVGQSRTNFGGFIGFEMAFTEPHTVVRRHGRGQDTP